MSSGSALLSAAVACALLAAPSAKAADMCSDYTAAKSTWEQHMKDYGNKMGQYISPGSSASFDEKLNAVYYDGQWVFQQIGDYLGQSSPWKEYAEYARRIYVDQYMSPNGFKGQGYRRFPHGIYFDWKRGGSSTADQVVKMRDMPSFSYLTEFSGVYLGSAQSMSREAAYALQANILAERAGQQRYVENGTPRVNQLVAWMEEHFRQWKSQSFMQVDIDKGESRFAPFMAALSLSALIETIEWEEANGRNPDDLWPKKVWPSIEAMMKDFLAWQRNSARMRDSGQQMWTGDGQYRAFVYEDKGDPAPAWDLNQLIAYPYAWLASRLEKQGNTTDAQFYAQVADELFIGGANRAWLDGMGKMFDQSYRTSIQTVALRKASTVGACATSAGPVASTPVTSPSPAPAATRPRSPAGFAVE